MVIMKSFQNSCYFYLFVFHAFIFLEIQMSWERLAELRAALKKLPPAHYNTLSYLMAHLYR